MNAHQRRKHIRHHRPLIQQITATLTLLDMPERAKTLQATLCLRPLRAIRDARRYERFMPESDCVIEPFYGKQWGKSIYAKQLHRALRDKQSAAQVAAWRDLRGAGGHPYQG